MKTTVKADTYENVYLSLWETAQRYHRFAGFRVIGSSHDGRMIPMLELGRGAVCIFCVGGLEGRDLPVSGYLTRMAEEYAKACEFGWSLENFYDLSALLDRIRICLIPILNPDGCEVFQKGYSAIRNPIYRQMLRMQNQPNTDFTRNARGVRLNENFPTEYFCRKQHHEQPGSENETRALIRIFQEYESRGLLVFGIHSPQIHYCSQKLSLGAARKARRLARYLQKCSGYPLSKYEYVCGNSDSGSRSSGSLEQYYSQRTKQAALTISLCDSGNAAQKKEEKPYQELRLLPAEYIYSLIS